MLLNINSNIHEGLFRPTGLTSQVVSSLSSVR